MSKQSKTISPAKLTLDDIKKLKALLKELDE